MGSTNDKELRPLDAGYWTGSLWLSVLCVLQLSIFGIYLLTHAKSGPGYEYVTLTGDQVKEFTNLVGIYSDTDKTTSELVSDTVAAVTDTTGQPGNVQTATQNDSTQKAKTHGQKPGTPPQKPPQKETASSGAKAANAKLKKVKDMRKQRARLIERFLQSSLNGDVGEKAGQQGNTILEKQLVELDSTFTELNAKDLTNFVLSKKFKVDSYFWLGGANMYWEAIFWSLFGVFVSLIYYVSLANQLALQKKVDDDIGPFDPGEISSQVAKMFYAPAVTLVFVLGYSYFAGKNQGAIDISANHGLILFAFVAGFYSGRLMKLLDNLKNSILPSSSDGGSTAGNKTDKAGSADITVTVTLAPSMSANPAVTSIVQAGFNNATVTLTPIVGSGGSGSGGSSPGAVITLDKPAEDQGVTFTGSKIPCGKYTIKAKLAFTSNTTVINLSGTQDIEVSADKKSFTVALSQDNISG